MAVSFQQMLAKAKAEITEVTPDDVSARLEKPPVFLDVREPDEYEQGAIERAVHIPRGMLETQVANRIPDPATEIVAYCAGGSRSAFAARTLAEMGYTNVTSLAGGFTAWKRDGLPWKRPQTLTSEQRNRYSRHLLLPEIGEEGQQALLGARVLLLGAGGLGSPAALYLAAAGVGTLGIVDFDVVDESNLQRQILHNVDRVGQLKVESARETIMALNPDVKVEPYNARLGADNVLEIMSGYDVVVDGTDNFPTRYLVNDASLHLDVPVVHGSIFRFEGQVTVFKPWDGPCYRCLYPSPPPPELAPSCAEAGVLGVLPGIIGSLEALEAIKLITGAGESLVGRLLTYDALENSFRTLRLRRDPNCPACPDRNMLPPIVEYDQFCIAPNLQARH